MSLELNLGDVVTDSVYGVKVIIVGRRNLDGTLQVLEQYEESPEVVRLAGFLQEDNLEGRLAIVVENLGGGMDVGEGYYTWIDDPSLAAVRLNKHTLELGQRIFDKVWDEEGVIVARVVDGNCQVLDGYEDNEELKEMLWAISDVGERLAFMPNAGVTYTYVNDHEVTEIND